MKKIIVVVTLAALFYSCSFNKAFLQPTVFPQNITFAKQPTSKKNDTLVVLFSGATHQPTFTINRKDTLKMNYTIESVNFKSADGNILNGWFLKPKNAKAKITILHLHGNAGCLLDQYRAIAPLVKDTFQIFMFDYSGFGFSNGKPTRKNVLIDANSALDYLESRADVKNTKIVIYGQSLGGNLAPVLASERQNEIDGLVTEGAFSSHKDIAAHEVPILGRLFVKQGYSAKKAIRNFHKPYLLIHSREDKTVPFYMSKIIFKNANEPKEFYAIDKCHICGPTYYADSISIKIKNMLANGK